MTAGIGLDRFSLMKPYSGIGLRPPHYSEILSGKFEVSWFEVISENFMDTEGRPLHVLEQIRALSPIGLHGVSLNIGSSDPVNVDYLTRLKTLIHRIQPQFVSDHLCWGGVEGRNWHDLLPLPMTESIARHTIEKILKVQDFLGQRICLENVSTYLRFKEDEMTEWEFIQFVAEQSDCFLLLDVNNVYVNAFNHAFDAQEFIQNIPAYRVMQYHLAGHSNYETFLFDTHDHAIDHPVWDLFKHTVKEIGPRPFIIERDDLIPSLRDVEAEALKAQSIIEDVLRENYGKPKNAENISVDSRV